MFNRSCHDGLKAAFDGFHRAAQDFDARFAEKSITQTNDTDKPIVLNDFEFLNGVVVVRRDPATYLDIATITALFDAQRNGQIDRALAWHKELDSMFAPLENDWGKS